MEGLYRGIWHDILDLGSRSLGDLEILKKLFSLFFSHYLQYWFQTFICFNKLQDCCRNMSWWPWPWPLFKLLTAKRPIFKFNKVELFYDNWRLYVHKGIVSPCPLKNNDVQRTLPNAIFSWPFPWIRVTVDVMPILALLFLEVIIGRGRGRTIIVNLSSPKVESNQLATFALQPIRNAIQTSKNFWIIWKYIERTKHIMNFLNYMINNIVHKCL